MFADLARRGLTHPNTVAYVKRAVLISSEDVESRPEKIDMPTWGIVLLYVSVWIALVGVTMVCSDIYSIRENAHADNTARCPT